MKPLELTRKECHTKENLNAYFETAKDVLVSAGVTKVNPDFDPDMLYYEAIIITHPERIGSYDETKVEMVCTKAGSKDKTIMTSKDNKATIIVTKSSKTASAVCGRL